MSWEEKRKLTGEHYSNLEVGPLEEDHGEAGKRELEVARPLQQTVDFDSYSPRLLSS